MKLGRIAQLWRFPLKSLGGETVDETSIGPRGVRGDRALALLDVQSGQLVSAKRVQEFPGLLHLCAAYLTPPRAGQPLPPVRVRLPGGRTLTSDAADADHLLSQALGREVRLVRAAAEQDPPASPATSGLFAAYGGISAAPGASLFDAFPLSLQTTGAAASTPTDTPPTSNHTSTFEPRRYRMNLVVEEAGRDHPENAWAGQELQVGETLRLHIAMPTPRCVMTTLAQPELPQDPALLRRLSRENLLELPGIGTFPCAGVYAKILVPGTVRVGDLVRAV